MPTGQGRCLRARPLPRRSAVLALLLPLLASLAFPQSSALPAAALGFDRNDYPGDDRLAELRHTFAYSGYWLNLPPGAKLNQWRGKRQKLEDAGFGFLVLFNGRLYAELKTVSRAQALGRSDAEAASAAAGRDGFHPGTVIFLDQEQGGRMLPEQKAYIFAWVDGVEAAGFKAGIYCSGIPAADDGNVVTALDLKENARGRNIVYWVTNDVCPPSPGCELSRPVPAPGRSGVAFARVWQFAQSPARHDFAGQCPKNYSPDGGCYAPGHLPGSRLAVDLNSATDADPSRGRTPEGP